MTPLLVLMAAAVVSGFLAFLAIRRFPKADPALTDAVQVGQHLRQPGRVRAFVRARMDPTTSTGLALTIAFVGLVLAGVVVGVAVWMIRRESGLVVLDRSVERWAEQSSTAATDAVLRVVTDLGGTLVVVFIAIAVALVGVWRWRRWAIPVFLTLVIAGQSLITNQIKFWIERARPELRPRADFTGASFPSGHSATAAACYLALALVLSIGVSPRARAILLGAGVAIGVAVGTTRMFLGVHWFSDVLAGLLIGWAWFGLCAVAFGGRMMRFGTPAKVASRPGAAPEPAPDAKNVVPRVTTRR